MPQIAQEHRLCCSTRLSLAVLSFFGCVVIYSLRVNLSVAIVAMVNRTAIKEEQLARRIYQNLTINSDCEDSNLGLNNADITSDADKGEFAWDKKTQGSILGAFFWGYLFTQILGGWMAQRFGAKRIILFNVCVSILATLLTPLAAKLHYTALICVRVMMGLVQGSMYPGFIVLWTNWAPVFERSKLISFTFAGLQIGYVAALPIAGFLCEYGFAGGWPSVFYTFGLASIIWTVAWFVFASDTPQAHRFITENEKSYIIRSLGHNLEGTAQPTGKFSDVPWLSILKSLPILGCFAAHFAGDWGVYLMLTCMPLFLNEVLRFDVTKLGFVASVPYIACMIGMNAGGIIADFLIKKHYLSAVNVRRLITAVALGSQAICLVAAGYCNCGQEILAIFLLTLAMGLSGMQSAGFLVSYMEIAPRYAGLIVGVGNTISCIGGILGPIVMSALTPHNTRSEWLTLFYVTAVILVAGAVIFCLFAKGDVQPWAEDQSNNILALTKEPGEEERLNTSTP